MIIIGNVGIGSQIPAYKLDVSWDINAIRYLLNGNNINNIFVRSNVLSIFLKTFEEEKNWNQGSGVIWSLRVIIKMKSIRNTRHIIWRSHEETREHTNTSRTPL